MCKRGGDVVLAENDDLNLRMKIANFANGLEAIHAGHAEIHNDDIRMEILRLQDRFVAVSSLTADFDVEHGGQQGANAAANEVLIVNNQHPQSESPEGLRVGA